MSGRYIEDEGDLFGDSGESMDTEESDLLSRYKTKRSNPGFESLRNVGNDIPKQLRIVIVGTMAVQLAMLLVMIITGLILLSLRTKGNYAQLLSGETIEVGEKELNYRSTQTIRRFVFDSLTMMFTWNGIIPMQEEGVEQVRFRLDPGLTIEGGARVPTVAYEASFAFREGLRQSILKEISTTVPPGLLSGSSNPGTQRDSGGVQPGSVSTAMRPQVQTVLIIDFISNPKPIRDGVWQVDVIANLVLLRANSTGRQMSKFNKRLTIAAVERGIVKLNDELPMLLPLVRVRQSGLQIREITNLEI